MPTMLRALRYTMKCVAKRECSSSQHAHTSHTRTRARTLAHAHAHDDVHDDNYMKHVAASMYSNVV